jgi:hypothetical protein
MNQVGTVNGTVDVEAARKDLPDQLTAVCTNAMEAVDAQLAISALKTARIIIMVAFSILAMVGMAIVIGYGCFLLDGCLANALSVPPLPVWIAPLVRGVVYVAVPATGLLYIWHSTVGFDSEQL